MGPRVPGGSVEDRERIAMNVSIGHQRHAMPDVGVEIDPRDVALSSIARLMALEEEVCPVVVAIECGPLLGILERHRALSPYDFGQLDRENVGPGYSKRLGVRRRNVRQ